MTGVLCLTWNLELDKPDKETLERLSVDWINKWCPDKAPEIIVIGLQEAASYTLIGNKFIGEKLKAKELLGGGDFAKDPYVLVDSLSFKGVTDKSQIIGYKAQQAIQVLARKSIAKKLKVKTFKGTKAFYSEKGFVGVDIVYNGKRLGFISTHLDAGSEKTRAQDCESIRKFLLKRVMDPKFGKYHALFLMGDMNFRVKTFKATRDDQNRISLEPKIYQEKPDPQDGLLIIDLLTKRAGRKMLRALDSFYDSTCFDELPFVWPEFGADDLPTYKRRHKKEYYGVISLLRELIEPSTGEFNDDYKQHLRAVYTKKGDKKTKEAWKDNVGYKKKRKQWDFGWLDRIGYALPVEGHFNSEVGRTDFLQEGVTLANSPWLYSFYDVPFGDHAAVACLFQLRGVSGEDTVMTVNPLYGYGPSVLDIDDDVEQVFVNPLYKGGDEDDDDDESDVEDSDEEDDESEEDLEGSDQEEEEEEDEDEDGPYDPPSAW